MHAGSIVPRREMLCKSSMYSCSWKIKLLFGLMLLTLDIYIDDRSLMPMQTGDSDNYTKQLLVAYIVRPFVLTRNFRVKFPQFICWNIRAESRITPSLLSLNLLKYFPASDRLLASRERAIHEEDTTWHLRHIQINCWNFYWWIYSSGHSWISFVFFTILAKSDQ
jgi:hypothetical protein